MHDVFVSYYYNSVLRVFKTYFALRNVAHLFKITKILSLEHDREVSLNDVISSKIDCVTNRQLSEWTICIIDLFLI